MKCTIAGISSNNNLIINSYSVGDTVIDCTVIWTIYNEQQNYKIISNQNVNDLNTCTKLGIYRYRDTTLNVPIEAQKYGTVMTLYPRQEDENVCSQIAQGVVSGDIFVRQTLDDRQTWSEWKRLVTANEAEIVVSKIFAGNGYIKYTSGLILQWGAVQTNEFGTATIAFPILFTSTNYTITATPGDNTPRSISLVGKTVSGIDVFRSYATPVLEGIAGPAFWFAIGY